MVGMLQAKEVEALLESQRFARLGCHAGGETYVVPVSYAYAKGKLYGVTTLGRKIEMMRANPNVCVEIDDVKSLTEWRSAIVWGRFEELDGIAAAEALGLLLDRFGPIFNDDYQKGRLGRNLIPDPVTNVSAPQVVYAITITQKTGRFERPDA